MMSSSCETEAESLTESEQVDQAADVEDQKLHKSFFRNFLKRNPSENMTAA